MKIEHSRGPFHCNGGNYISIVGADGVGIGRAEAIGDIVDEKLYGNATLFELSDSAPHECSVPDCPGNRNQLRLELWDEMLAALSELTSWVRAYASISQPNDDARFTRMCSENDKAEEIVRKAKQLK